MAENKVAGGTREFKPIGGLGDPVLLVGNQGVVSPRNAAPVTGSGQAGVGNSAQGATDLLEIIGFEPIPPVGPRGELVIYSQADTAPAGYGLDRNAASGDIAAGQTISIAPAGLVPQLPWQIFQCRFRIREIASLGTPTINDIDLGIQNPANIPRWLVNNNNQGVVNSGFQSAIPSDAAVAPAQGNPWGVPATNTGGNFWDDAWETEQFLWGNQSPVTITLTNRNTANAVTTGAIALEVWGIMYNLAPWTFNGTYSQADADDALGAVMAGGYASPVVAYAPIPMALRTRQFVGLPVVLPRNMSDLEFLRDVSKVQVQTRTNAQQ